MVATEKLLFSEKKSRTPLFIVPVCEPGKFPFIASSSLVRNLCAIAACSIEFV